MTEFLPASKLAHFDGRDSAQLSCSSIEFVEAKVSLSSHSELISKVNDATMADCCRALVDQLKAINSKKTSLKAARSLDLDESHHIDPATNDSNVGESKVIFVE